jgi:hypothetical protein
VIDHNLVSIPASSIFKPDSSPARQVADFENHNGFDTKNEANSWICSNFKEMQIEVTYHSIRNRRDSNSHHLHSWRLEGSKDELR